MSHLDADPGHLDSLDQLQGSLRAAGEQIRQRMDQFVGLFIPTFYATTATHDRGQDLVVLPEAGGLHSGIYAGHADAVVQALNVALPSGSAIPGVGRMDVAAQCLCGLRSTKPAPVGSVTVLQVAGTERKVLGPWEYSSSTGRSQQPVATAQFVADALIYQERSCGPDSSRGSVPQHWLIVDRGGRFSYFPLSAGDLNSLGRPGGAATLFNVHGVHTSPPPDWADTRTTFTVSNIAYTLQIPDGSEASNLASGT